MLSKITQLPIFGELHREYYYLCGYLPLIIFIYQKNKEIISEQLKWLESFQNQNEGSFSFFVWKK